MKRLLVYLCVLLAVLSAVDVNGRSIHGGGGGGAGVNPLLSQRSGLNIGFIYHYNYAFINRFLSGDASVGPVSTNYASTTSTWMQLIDPATGWPNNSAASGHSFGGSVRITGSSNFSGPYIATWDGSGDVSLQSGTCTELNSQVTYTRISNCHWQSVNGQKAYVKFTWTGFSDVSLPGVQFPATGGANGFLRNFQLYDFADETRLLAGKIFRQPFLDEVAKLNPGFIRVMDWHGGNNSQNNRWEYRTLPNAPGYGNNTNWTASPPYGDATGVNQYSLAAVTTGSNQTPASMLHGETATMRFGTGTSMVRAGRVAIQSIGTGNNPTVAASGHPFQNGDTIIFTNVDVPAPTGMMQKLRFFPVTVANVVAGVSFTINVDTTTWGAFTNAFATQYVTMQIGSGNDRTPYPVIFSTGGGANASVFGNGYINAGDYKTMVFDKTAAAKMDGNGNWIYGVWIFNENGNDLGHSGDVPVEICVALANEINERELALGFSQPTHLWLNMPQRALLPVDPDYTTGSDYALNAINVALNGNTVAGVTYAGLTSRAGLIVENSNETWNFGGGAFSQTFWYWWKGYQRWPASGTSDGIDMASYRTVAMARDVRSVYASNPRVKVTLGGWGALGFATGEFNYARVYGGSTGNNGQYYTNDSEVVAGAWGTPISNHDAFNTASYFDPSNLYYSTLTGTATFTNDSAMYNGTDNSGTLTITGGTGGVSSTTLVTTAVTGGPVVVGQPLVGTGITSPTTTVAAVAGVSPNYTLTLSAAATVTNGTTIKSPTNSGGNYIGAANQSQAITNFVAQVSSSSDPDAQTIALFQTLKSTYASSIPAGKKAIEYEGGFDWPVGPFESSYTGHFTTVPESIFSRAVANSSQWGTAQIGYLNTVQAIGNTGLPSVYLIVNGNENATSFQRWAYATPDSWALNGGTPTEGQALLNNSAWTGMSSRNQALSP